MISENKQNLAESLEQNDFCLLDESEVFVFSQQIRANIRRERGKGGRQRDRESVVCSPQTETIEDL